MLERRGGRSFRDDSRRTIQGPKFIFTLAPEMIRAKVVLSIMAFSKCSRYPLVHRSVDRETRVYSFNLYSNKMYFSLD